MADHPGTPIPPQVGTTPENRTRLLDIGGQCCLCCVTAGVMPVADVAGGEERKAAWPCLVASQGQFSQLAVLGCDQPGESTGRCVGALPTCWLCPVQVVSMPPNKV